MKKSKTTLTLMEQLIMIAVFAVAVAVCLRVFAFANSRSEQNLINDVANRNDMTKSVYEAILSCR